MPYFQYSNAFIESPQIRAETRPWAQYALIGSWFVFVFLWCLPKTPVSTIPLALFLITMFGDWFGLKLLFRQYRIEIILTIVTLALGILFSALPAKSVKGAYDFLRGGLVIFPTILMARTRPHLFWVFLPWGLGVACLVFTAGALEVIIRAGNDLAGQRTLLETYFGNPNHFGAGAAMVALLALVCLWIFPGRWPIRTYFLLIAFVCLGLMLFSGSRGSVLAFIVGLIYLAFVSLKQWRWLILSGGCLLVVGFIGLLSLDFVHSFGGIWYRGDDFSSGRLGIYFTTLSETRKESKFFGFGINTFKYLNVGQVHTTRVIMPHNLLLELFYSLGLVGSAMFLFAFARLGLLIYQGRAGRFPLTVVGGCILVFVLARGVIDLKLWSVYVPGLVGCGLGLLLAPLTPENSPPERIGSGRLNL